MERVLAQFEDVSPAATATPGASAWLARETGTGRQVLIKRLPSEEAKARATQALTLQHPRIVPTRRWVRDGDGFFVIRDYLPGQNVRQALLGAASWTYERLQALFLPLLDALEYAHQRGLSHGGITPENVLLVGDQGKGPTVLSDWATSLVTPKDYEIPPTPRTDFVAICQLYKEFLPSRPREDETEQGIRLRLVRNLTEVQRTVQDAEELRYKLDAVARMADLLGYQSQGLADGKNRQGARLVASLTPPLATVNTGGGGSVALTVRNEGDVPLHLESIRSEAVWLNPAAWATPVDLAPDTERDIPITVSAARLDAGSYQGQLIIHSNSGMTARIPNTGATWHEQIVTVPVAVSDPAAPASPEPSISPAEPAVSEVPTAPVDDRKIPGIACVQEPDPGLVRYGQQGVLHLGVQNVGPRRLRLDKLSTNPSWLVYPGEWKPVWIGPGETQYLGFSVLAQNLAGGDFRAVVTLLTSSEEPTLVGSQTIWREMRCDVRVRVVRGAEDVKAVAHGAGCATALLALTTTGVGIMALLLSRY